MRISIITDEICEDAELALDRVQQWGLSCVELRSVWGKNVVDLEAAELARLDKLVRARHLSVSAIASPFLKCWLGDSQRGPTGDSFFARERSYSDHLELLDHLVDIAKRFDTQLIRGFAFWREPNPVAVWPSILKHFEEPVRRAELAGITLAIENESSTNVGTGADCARLVRDIGSPHLQALWDPGNAMYAGEEPFPTGYEHVRKYVSHVHIKDVRRRAGNGQLETVPAGHGEVDYRQQLKALASDGYSGALTLEPHYHPKGVSTAEAAKECVRALQTLLTEESLL